MLKSSIPPKIPLAWAASAGGGFINYPVPTPSQIGITNGAASFTDGFPPNTFVAEASGGAGPFGKDFNGIFKQLTADMQWQQAQGIWTYDAAFQSTIGGYPNGALVQSATTVGTVWQSTADNNVTNPDAAGAGWTKVTATSGLFDPAGAAATAQTNSEAFAAALLTGNVAAAGTVAFTVGSATFYIKWVSLTYNTAGAASWTVNQAWDSNFPSGCFGTVVSIGGRSIGSGPAWTTLEFEGNGSASQASVFHQISAVLPTGASIGYFAIGVGH